MYGDSFSAASRNASCADRLVPSCLCAVTMSHAPLLRQSNVTTVSVNGQLTTIGRAVGRLTDRRSIHLPAVSCLLEIAGNRTTSTCPGRSPARSLLVNEKYNTTRRRISRIRIMCIDLKAGSVDSSNTCACCGTRTVIGSGPTWWQDTEVAAPPEFRSWRLRPSLPETGPEMKHVTPLSNGSSYAEMRVWVP